MNGWVVRPTLDRASATGRSLAQAAGSLVAGSPLPQALIQCRQRLTNELRLGTLVILSWSAPQPVADDSAVAQPPTASSPGSSAPQNGPGTRRHATSRARRHSAKSLRAEQRGCMCPPPRTWLAHPQWRRYPAHNWRHFPARSHRAHYTACRVVPTCCLCSPSGRGTRHGKCYCARRSCGRNRT